MAQGLLKALDGMICRDTDALAQVMILLEGLDVDVVALWRIDIRYCMVWTHSKSLR
jgi:hypothetical protein